MISMANLTPMLMMSNAEIDRLLTYGLYGLAGRKIRQVRERQHHVQTLNLNNGHDSEVGEQSKTFRVTWATGCITIKPANFCKLPLRNIDEFLRFAKSRCNDKQQARLIAMLEAEKRQACDNAWSERLGKVIQRVKAQRWERVNNG